MRKDGKKERVHERKGASEKKYPKNREHIKGGRIGGRGLGGLVQGD